MANVTAVSIHAVVFAITCCGRLIGGTHPLGGFSMDIFKVNGPRDTNYFLAQGEMVIAVRFFAAR